jgi:protocatechuate 3,4-dioxygenase beta subunit
VSSYSSILAASMTSRLFGTGAMIAASVALAAIVHGQAQVPAATGRGVIIGRVVDGSSGEGIASAIVTLTGGPGSGRGNAPAAPDRVGTDARGNFAFTSLPAGTYSITVTKLGYVDSGHGVRRPGGARTDVLLVDGERLIGVRLQTWQHASISGTVLDDGNEPVVGVMVRALRWSFVAGRRRLVAAGQAPTDDRGMYRIGSLLPGEYVTVVPSTQAAIPASVADAYVRDPSNAVARGAIASASISFPQAGSLRVGDMVISRNIYAAIQPDPSRTGAMAVVPTTFHPSAPMPAQAGTIALASGAHKSADIHLPLVSTARVTGTLATPGGSAGLQAVRLVPRWADDLASETGYDAAVTLTDAEGRFTFIGVAPGPYILRSAQVPRPGPPAPGSSVAGPAAPTLYVFQPVTVGTQDVSLALVMRNGLRVSGRFTFIGTSGPPPADRLRQVPIVLEPADGRAVITVPPSPGDPAGTFSTYAVPPGRYFVRVGGAPSGWTLKSVVYDGRDAADRPLDLQDGDASAVIITFTDTPAQLSGTVRGARGAADGDASVVVFPVDPEGWTDVGINPRRLRTARVTPAGTFSFSTLPGGDYFIAAIPDEDAGSWQDPRFLETLSRRATRVTLADGDRKIQDLTTIR